MVQDISKSIEACAAHYGSDADAMREYLINGQKMALKWTIAGRLFLSGWLACAAYRRGLRQIRILCVHRVLGEEELEDIKQDLEK